MDITTINQHYCAQTPSGPWQLSFQILACTIFSRYNSKSKSIFQNLPTVKKASTCDACEFDGTDTDDCKVYGKIDNKELIAWYFGSEKCRNLYNIKINSPDPKLICASSSAFVNDLRFGSLKNSPAKLGLGVSDGGFFYQDPKNTQLILIKDTITIDGKSNDCKASESNCYNAMKPYFASNTNGKKEMEDVCTTLENKFKVDNELEQSTLRIRLCNEHKDSEFIPSECNPLWPQLEVKIKEYPNKACSGFGFGPGTTPIPGCSTPTLESTSSAGARFFSWGVMVLGNNILLTMWVLIF